jgi:hypothetical protein
VHAAVPGHGVGLVLLPWPVLKLSRPGQTLAEKGHRSWARPNTMILVPCRSIKQSGPFRSRGTPRGIVTHDRDHTSTRLCRRRRLDLSTPLQSSTSWAAPRSCTSPTVTPSSTDQVPASWSRLRSWRLASTPSSSTTSGARTPRSSTGWLEVTCCVDRRRPAPGPRELVELVTGTRLSGASRRSRGQRTTRCRSASCSHSQTSTKAAPLGAPSPSCGAPTRWR